MKYLQNLHTHSTFCDGADTPEEMILTALEKGFDSLGFSGHGSMSPERRNAYIAEILRLKEAYADRLPIYLGIEQDVLEDVGTFPFDYRIGAAHYLIKDGERIGVDGNRDRLLDAFRRHYCTDGMAYVRDYYAMLTRLPERGKFDILAHIDLVTKYHDLMPLFDPDAPSYRACAIEAAEALAGKIPFFEVNTGAIARGYRTTPYPAPFLLKEMKRLGFRAVISSDCHRRDMLDCCFSDAEQLLLDAGFTEHWVLTAAGFVPFPLA